MLLSLGERDGGQVGDNTHALRLGNNVIYATVKYDDLLVFATAENQYHRQKILLMCSLIERRLCL